MSDTPKISEDEIRALLEEQGIDAEKIEEILPVLQRDGVSSPGAASAADSINDMEEKLHATEDWKERARIAAKIISMRFDT